LSFVYELGVDLGSGPATLNTTSGYEPAYRGVLVLICPSTDIDDPAAQIAHALALGPLGSAPLRRRDPLGSDRAGRHDSAEHDDPAGREIGAGVGLGTEQVAGPLAGIAYPARRWEIVAWAQYNGASPMMTEMLLAIAEREYPGPTQIARALPGTAKPTCCRHSRHPRNCPQRSSHHQYPPLRASA
jgi:hypothetical protein